ncbi:hypothetical protein HHL22_21735 [Hymenobacter sp. RP-2-7]|uniref:Uncharacterized protein n=1 Tax=Hymenobacter polaris TaxID=2682546 RepID=A0A7Y0AI86_9BACT|nr:hypothetical protein [Hymenobacter polaris]NML67833.1 hypothetical protein [Hymenobacter polaris]
MSAPSDALLTKTDAELQFFVDNPQLYQPALVEAARRELARRAAEDPRVSSSAAMPDAAEAAATAATTSALANAAPTPPAAPVYATPAPFAPPPALDYPATYLDEPARRRPWLVPLLILLAVAAGFGVYRWSAAHERAAQAEAKRAAARLTPDALKLDAVATTAMPEYNITALVDKQLAKVPAAEKADAQPLRQFREMSRRFWVAETQSEYLTQLADQGKAGAAFASQALLARENWRAWNKGAMYGYKFGPRLQEQYELMGKVASSQQHILARLPDLLANKGFLTDKELVNRTGDVQAWMADLAAVSPVTGRAYEITTLQAR